MVKKIVLSLVCTGALFAGNTEVEQLKQQMAQLQKQLEQMQQHIAALEAQTPKETAVAEESLESMEKTSTASVTTLLPDIALILNGGYTSRNVGNDTYAAAAIPGFVEAGNMEIPFNAKDGFNFNYAEVAMSSTVDPYLDASAIFHIRGDGGIEIEEAYFVTRALDYGLRFKAGKFKSAFGRVNEKHHHAWNFEDQELINNALFGPDGLGGAGAQLQWVAPTSLYLMAGFELFNGNPYQGFSAKESASTAVGYLKTSTDVADATLLAGLSYAQGKSEVQNLDGLGDPIPNSFTNYGQTRVYGADLTLEYPFENYGQLIWQNEWMQRDKDVETLTQRQSGYYSELLYKIDENWAMGLRYDDIYQNRTGDSLTSIDHLHRTSVKLEYKPFEFSRFRLQYNQDHSKYIDDQAKTIHEVMLNYTLKLGAHGAHAF
ncbi:MAG: hypothetical protein PHO52_00685 [Sulfuricurvum sp.]|uniref:hypothetical protein n=1 Tax=Sulfuricurvum sp. TaxID=2025608 RepID=UPI002609303D|nr:hypothetical protein [Sulfuricurvum sp.]MDD2782710.1 hypothetical protein [Sulfuricurvum sp.]